MMEELVRNAWHIPVIMGMVLVYALLLDAFLFRPVSRVLAARRRRGEESSSLADSSREELERKFAEYEEAVLEARRRGTRVKEEARSEVAVRRESIIEAVRGELRDEMGKAEAELAVDVSKARADIEASAPALARLAADRILGRGGSR